MTILITWGMYPLIIRRYSNIVSIDVYDDGSVVCISKDQGYLSFPDVHSLEVAGDK